MSQLPLPLAALYRPALDYEICSWSFGAVRAPRDPHARSWRVQQGTLDDQAIFGALQDLHCACGKYEGERYRGWICDECGVKLATREARRQRFGHINLPVAVQHPLGQAGEQLSRVPVLPAAFWQSPGGGRLAQAYDDLARAAMSGASSELAAELTRLVDVLLPVTTVTFEWDLTDARTLAQSLALHPRQDGP